MLLLPSVLTVRWHGAAAVFGTLDRAAKAFGVSVAGGQSGDDFTV